MFSLHDIITVAVQIEENAERVFREAAANASNPSLVSLFGWLADEELRHAKVFSELGSEVRMTAADPVIEVLGGEILSRILGDQTFSLDDVDFSGMNRIQEVLLAAIEFEQDTVLFYEMIRSFVQDQDESGLLDTIIEEEKEHIRSLQEFLKSGSCPGEIEIQKGGLNHA